jgi:hypothetical protein
MAKKQNAPGANRRAGSASTNKKSVLPAPATVKLKSRVASMDPDQMSSRGPKRAALMPGEFPDVNDLMRGDRLGFTVQEGDAPAHLSMRSYPSQFLADADKLRGRSGTIPIPSRSTTTACCIFVGLDAIEQHPNLEALREVRDEIANTDFENSMVEDLTVSWLDGFDKTVALPAGGTKRLNVVLPTELKSQLSRAADSMGVDIGLLAILCIALVLAAQPDIHDDHRARAQDMVDQFLLRVRWQVLGTRGLLEFLTKSHGDGA